YNNNFRINATTQPSPGGTEALVAYHMQGIPAAGTGTQASPAAPVLAAGATASYTDPRNNSWKSYLDWLGLGELIMAQDPLADTSVAYVDANGLPWLTADGLGRRTRSVFDSKGN